MDSLVFSETKAAVYLYQRGEVKHGNVIHMTDSSSAPPRLDPT